MNTHILKKISAVCLVLAVSAAAWACGGNGGSCGDKNKKDTTVITSQVESSQLTACEGKGDSNGGGCKGSGSGTKEK
jgi:hypothetical protein